jgi:hypothetical protein
MGDPSPFKHAKSCRVVQSSRVGVFLAVTAAAVVAAGCLVSSLHPVYDDDSIVFDETLVGTWTDKESEVSIVVGRGQWRSYHIAYTDRFGTTKFTGHLTRVGSSRFLNVRPEDGLERQAFLVATNGVMQIEVEPARVRVREPEYASVLARLNAGKLGLDASTDLKQNVIITAPTRAVRSWLLKALDDEEMWADWKTLTRSAQ